MDDLHLPRQLPLLVAPASLQAWSMPLRLPASPCPVSVLPWASCCSPVPPLIAPLILAPLRNCLDDVPFRLNFFLGGLCVLCVCVSVSVQIRFNQAKCTQPHRPNRLTSPFCPSGQCPGPALPIDQAKPSQARPGQAN
jgi:hypothetical protein